jgi:CubicO group peptidase (beta-lactamase class C family)
MARMFEVGGTVERGYEPVRDAFQKFQAQDPGGAQLCVYRHGKRVVDIWGGKIPEKNAPYTPDTIAVLMSCTKGAVAVCANLLAQRGALDIEAPVTRYWPEFAGGGKGDVRVRHLLTHSVGLMGLDPEADVKPEDLFHRERVNAVLEKMTPLWPPGSAYFYHFVTFGTLVGEIVRRVSGKSVGRFFAENVAGPLKLDLWIGLPEEQEHRRAAHFLTQPQIPMDQWRTMFQALGVDLDTRLLRALLATFESTNNAIEDINEKRELRANELPAGNGIGNARSLAKMYASLIGEVDGVRLFEKETMERARAVATAGLSAPEELKKTQRGDPMPFGLGFELPSIPKPMLGKGSFGHSGAGGRLGFAHPESGIALGYVRNTMFEMPMACNPAWAGWTKALAEIAGVDLGRVAPA